MARFYFHLSSGKDYERDEVGSEHADANQAYLEAFETAQQMSVDLIRGHNNPGRHRFDICDEEGRVVFQVPFTEIVGHRVGPQEANETARRGHTLVTEVRDQIVSARAELETLWAAVKRI